MRFHVCVIASLVGALSAAAAASAQNAPVFQFTEKPGAYQVGLNVVEQYDYSRVYRPSTDELGKPYVGERARPLQTLIWYPAQTSAGKPMTVADYAELAATETSFGKPKMPSDAQERIDNASRMVDTAVAKGIPLERLYVDTLVFPISVDSQFVNHCLGAFRYLRGKYGERIHLTGGLSNVSFGMPCRKLINEVFLNLAVEAGATLGWWKYVGLDGDVIGIDRFGASAPGPKVMAEYGFTPENVATRAKALLKK